MSLLIRNLNKSFDMFQVLKNINLEIDQGEFLVLLGPSGCGKSTLLNCVAGLETIEDGGSILINDMDVTNLAPKDRKIAMVFQSYALYPTMNVRKNITFGLRCRGIPKAEIEDSLKKTVELLQIENLLFLQKNYIIQTHLIRLTNTYQANYIHLLWVVQNN